MEPKREEVQLWKYYYNKIQLGHCLENLGILNEVFTHVMVQTTLGTQTVMTNSNHGCVDGFSRKVLWLQVTRSNNNPVVPASYFLETV